MTAWWLLDDYLMTVWCLSVDYLTTVQRLSDDCSTTVWRLSDGCPMTLRRLSDGCPSVQWLSYLRFGASSPPTILSDFGNANTTHANVRSNVKVTKDTKIKFKTFITNFFYSTNQICNNLIVTKDCLSSWQIKWTFTIVYRRIVAYYNNNGCGVSSGGIQSK